MTFKQADNMVEYRWVPLGMMEACFHALVSLSLLYRPFFHDKHEMCSKKKCFKTLKGVAHQTCRVAARILEF